jgi:hypothetical protein
MTDNLIIPEIKLERGKQPRNLQDRSKYAPHQGKRECERRVRRELAAYQLYCRETSVIFRQHPVQLTSPATEEEMAALQKQREHVLRRGRRDEWKCSCSWCATEGSDIVPSEDRQDPPATSSIQDPL